MPAPADRHELPRALRLAQALFLLNAAVWLLFGIASLIRIAGGGQTVTFVVIALLMAGNAGAMLFCARGLGKQKKRFYYLALLVLLVNIVLTFTDQVGLFDWITLAIDLIALGLLVAARSWFFDSAGHQPAKSATKK